MRDPFARSPVRVAVALFGDNAHAGTIVVDERPGLSAGACRLCGGALFDRPTAAVATWLADHLLGSHGVGRITRADLGELVGAWRMGPARFRHVDAVTAVIGRRRVTRGAA